MNRSSSSQQPTLPRYSATAPVSVLFSPEPKCCSACFLGTFLEIFSPEALLPGWIRPAPFAIQQRRGDNSLLYFVGAIQGRPPTTSPSLLVFLQGWLVFGVKRMWRLVRHPLSALAGTPTPSGQTHTPHTHTPFQGYGVKWLSSCSMPASLVCTVYGLKELCDNYIAKAVISYL